MFESLDPQYHLQVVSERHEHLRRAAGIGRLRRDVRRQRRHIRRHGPDR